MEALDFVRYDLSVTVEEGLIGFFMLARSCVQKDFINWLPSLTQFHR